MNDKYTIKVNDTFDFDFTESESKALDVVPTSHNHFHIIKDNHQYEAEIVSKNFVGKKYLVKVNNNLYDVVIHDKLDNLIAEMGFEIDAKKQVNSLHAPMPGLILEIIVSVGQSVSANETLLILGAMKMENSFVSPRDGVIKSIAVATGDAVDKGQLLIEFE